MMCKPPDATRSEPLDKLFSPFLSYNTVLRYGEDYGGGRAVARMKDKANREGRRQREKDREVWTE